MANEGDATPVAGVEERDGAVVVRLAGELDLYNAHAVRDQLLAAAERGPERLVVDLSGLTFIDSTGLGVLIEARKAVPVRMINLDPYEQNFVQQVVECFLNLIVNFILVFNATVRL